MELRLYQAGQIKRVIRELKERALALLASAVGSGKTTVSKIIINEVIKSEVLGIKKVIISSPFLTIAKDFESAEDDEIWTAPSHPQYNASSYIIGGNSIKLIDDDSTREMRRVLKASSYDPRSFSHASLARIADMIDDPAVTFAYTLLVIDEAHHCFHDDEDDSIGGTILGKVVNRAIEKGAKVLYLTATPYRTEGRKTIPIVDTGACNPIIRTIGEQIRDGFSPSLDVEYIHIKGDYDFLVDKYKHEPTIVDGPFVIFSKPKQGRVYAEHVYDQWVKEECPKAIIVLPQGESVKTAEMVKTYFIERGFPTSITNRGRTIPSILDAVGDKITDRERIIREIQDDKRQHGRKYDLVIGCRRFDEGTDVPSASHVYMIGVPGNVRIFHQRAGRILRDKKSVVGYSEWFGDQWLNKAKAVFFVPLFSRVDKLGSQVARQLLHCIFAGENFQAYCGSASTSIELKKAVETHLKDAVGEHVGEVEEVLKAIDSFMMSEGINQSQRIADLTIEVKKNPDITVKEFCEKALEGVTDPVEKLAIQTAIVENLSCVSIEEVKNLAGEVIKKVISASSTKLKEEPGMILRPLDSVFQKEMGIAFQCLINSFGKKKVSFKSEGYVDRVLTSLTGEDLSYWTKQCEFLYDNEELGLARIKEICDHIDLNKKDPIATTYLGRSLSNLRSAYKNNGSTKIFPSYLIYAEQRGYPNLFETKDLLKEGLKILEEMNNWMLITKRNPSKDSEDPKEKYYGQKLSNIKAAKNGSLNSAWFPEYQDYANKIGRPHWFDIKDKEEEKLKRIQELFDFIDKNDRPKFHSNGYEKTMYRRLQLIREENDPVYHSIAKERGYPGIFEKTDLIKNIKALLIECFNYKKEYGVYPKNSKLSDRLMKLKKSKKSGKLERIFPGFQEFLDEIKCSDILDYIDRKKEGLKAISNICDFHDNKGHYPKTVAKGEERKLAVKHVNLKQGFHKKNRQCIHPEYIRLTKERGKQDFWIITNPWGHK